MQLVQFMIPGSGRRVGVVRSDRVLDLTANAVGPTSVVELAGRAFQQGVRLAALVDELARGVEQGAHGGHHDGRVQPVLRRNARN